MICPIRHAECKALKFLRDEKYCSELKKLLIDIHHNDCPGLDSFTQSLGCLCPACGRSIPLGQNLCTTCGFNLEDLK